MLGIGGPRIGTPLDGSVDNGMVERTNRNPQLSACARGGDRRGSLLGLSLCFL